MAFIEPRLIHLLNETTTTPRPHNAELPPIKTLPYHQTSGRPHPIEPDAQQDANGGQLAPQSIPSLYSMTDDSLTTPSLTAPSSNTSSSRKEAPMYAVADRPFSTHVSSQDLRMILDDIPGDTMDDVSTKKRPVKEDFPQLPQPTLKKQKAQPNQQHMFPPMIMGIHQPPSKNATLLPPISSGSIRVRSEPPRALHLTKPPPETQGVHEEPAVLSPSADAERTPTGKVKRRAAKPRRKWSEEETNHLLLGVSKHGVGRWTDILDDKEYNFNERTAGDLKDRFRTCCPEELRGSTGLKQDGLENPARTAPKTSKKPKKGLMAENILNEPDEEFEAEKTMLGQYDYDLAPKQRKSRAHRKKMEDLAELGIKGPFKKSQRRERRPFSEQDDREILQGFELYGPHWTKIQRDPRFNLSSRQPTDLRDRLRNKYPEKFVSTEKTTMQVRESSGRSNNLLEPSVTMDIENSLNVPKTTLLEPQLNRTGSREDIPKWPGFSEVAETTQPTQQAFWNENGPGGFPSGEMDISRLLLDDTQVMGEPLASERRGFG
ncbi:hypothetical protein GGR57DRAFT_309473 [Xylariaceae sp. FL1272]|nr:hypothetical protein GGR57DRAFT_309473 [Xylariaceae sp. FL1272]